jgi:MraZ protein
VVFTGTYEHAIDAKQRLAIPADVRALLQRELSLGESDPIPLYITLGKGGSLQIYTEAGFNLRAEQLDHSEWDPDRLLAYERVFFSQARRVTTDKQGRVRIPESQLARTGLDGDVVVLGVKDHLEVRDRQAWNDYVQRVLDDEPDLLMNPRQAMRSNADQRPTHTDPKAPHGGGI